MSVKGVRGTVHPRWRLMAEDDQWHDGALCRRLVNSGLREAEDWFSEHRPTQQRCQAACGKCLVQPERLDFAMRTRQNFGVWGGLTAAQRKVLRRKEART